MWGRVQQERDESYMRLALAEAEKALATGDIPVGAVLVMGEQVVGRGHNLREAQQNALLHAEICAIEEACHTLGRWRLNGCTLYVTMEPCPMCAGAIINARIDRVVYGVADEKAGCCGSVANFFAMPFNHSPSITFGVLPQECTAMLQRFFGQLRAKDHLPELDLAKAHHNATEMK